MELLEQQEGRLVFFIRRGPSEERIHLLMQRKPGRLEFRVMPSLYCQTSPDEGVIRPLLERMHTATIIHAAAALRSAGPRYYRISGWLETGVNYSGLLPENSPDTWKKVLKPQTPVWVNYDCYDRVGELQLESFLAVLPFPANLQGIRTKDDDYHIVRRL